MSAQEREQVSLTRLPWLHAYNGSLSELVLVNDHAQFMTGNYVNKNEMLFTILTKQHR